MELAESLALKNGKSAGEFMNYSFRSLKDIAGLQCVDMAGWVSYHVGRRNFAITSQPLHPFVRQAEQDFQSRGQWMLIFTVTRANLQDWFDKEQHTERSQEFIRQLREQKERKGSS